MVMKKRRDPDARQDPLHSELLAKGRQCTATSKRTGERCKNHVSIGMRTCRMHGSATKRSKVAAAKRIADASGFAADMLVEFMADPDVDIKLRTNIAQDLLDRANVSGTKKLEFFETDENGLTRYEQVVMASYRVTRAQWDEDGIDGPWPYGDFPSYDAWLAAGSPAIPVRWSQDIIDAEVVEDEAHEAKFDAEMLQREQQRAERKKRGRQAEPLPSEQRALDAARSPARPTSGLPKARARNEDDFNAKREAFLLGRMEGDKAQPKTIRWQRR